MMTATTDVLVDTLMQITNAATSEVVVTVVGPSTVVKSLNFEIIGIWTSVVVLSFARLDS